MERTSASSPGRGPRRSPSRTSLCSSGSAAMHAAPSPSTSSSKNRASDHVTVRVRREQDSIAFRSTVSCQTDAAAVLAENTFRINAKSHALTFVPAGTCAIPIGIEDGRLTISSASAALPSNARASRYSASRCINASRFESPTPVFHRVTLSGGGSPIGRSFEGASASCSTGPRQPQLHLGTCGRPARHAGSAKKRREPSPSRLSTQDANAAARLNAEMTRQSLGPSDPAERVVARACQKRRRDGRACPAEWPGRVGDREHRATSVRTTRALLVSARRCELQRVPGQVSSTWSIRSVSTHTGTASSLRGPPAPHRSHPRRAQTSPGLASELSRASSAPVQGQSARLQPN